MKSNYICTVRTRAHARGNTTVRSIPRAANTEKMAAACAVTFGAAGCRIDKAVMTPCEDFL